MGKHKTIWNRYTVYEDSRIYDNKRERFLKRYVNKNGYEVVNMSLNGKWFTLYVHRVVAQTFIDNRYGKKTVNHKDGNKLNNNLSNLEWNTYSENMRHAHSNDLKNNKHSKRRVIDVDTGETYNSVKEASEQTGISKHILYKSLSGSRTNKTSLRYE